MSEDVESEHLELAKKWLQPRHYYEIVEERSGSGKCGFPLCTNTLPSEGSNLRLSYLDKKLSDDGMSNKYCSSSCVERSQIYAGKLDESSPLTRAWVATLTPAEGRSFLISLILFYFI